MKLKITLSIFLLGLLGCSKNTGSVLLRMKYQKDDNQSFVIKLKTACGDAMYLNTEVEATFMVDSVVDKGDTYCFTTRITALKTDIKMPGLLSDGGEGVEEHYDSKKDFLALSESDRALSPQYQAIMAPYYAIAFNKQGEIVKPFSLSGKPIKAPFGAGLVMLPFPAHKVKIGDSWQTKIVNPLFNTNAKIKTFGKTFDFTYTVEDITADRVVIHVELVLEGFPVEKNTFQNVKADGQYFVDKATGRVVSGHINIPVGQCDDALISIVSGPMKSPYE